MSLTEIQAPRQRYILPDEQIFRLNVAVNDVLLVAIIQSFRQIAYVPRVGELVEISAMLNYVAVVGSLNFFFAINVL